MTAIPAPFRMRVREVLDTTEARTKGLNAEAGRAMLVQGLLSSFGCCLGFPDDRPTIRRKKAAQHPTQQKRWGQMYPIAGKPH